MRINLSLNFFFFIILSNIYFGQNGKKEFSIQEIFSSSKFFSKSLRMAKWLPNENKLSYLETDPNSRLQKIILFDPTKKTKQILVSTDDLFLEEKKEKVSIFNYEISPTKNKILFTGILPARRLKSGGDIFIYDLVQKKLEKTPIEGSSLNVKFSPNGKLIGYVLNNNIFIYDLESKTIKQLTFDGSEVILNGHFDWAYEEEFSIIDGWQFSPDCEYIAFWRLDQSRVPEIDIQQFDSLYFNSIKMRYPKAGGNISQVKIGVVNIKTGELKYFEYNEKDIYIPRIYWTSRKNELAILKLNRLQTEMSLDLWDISVESKKTIYNEKDTVWIDIEDFQIFFLSDRQNIILTSEKEEFNNIYILDYEGKRIKRITSNEWNLNSIVSIDEKNKIIYFLSGLGDPTSQYLCKIDFEGKKYNKLINIEGTTFATPSFDSKYFYIVNSSSSRPSQIILANQKGEIIETFIDNKDLIQTLSEYKFNEQQFLKFKTSDGETLYCSIIYPPNFDTTKKYPVLVYNYSGPGSQIARNIWGGSQYLWHQMLAQKGYIIFSLDNRGTGARGKSFKTIVYKNLGKYEINDLLEGCKFLKKLNYVDSSRIGIWGWSYGGYISALAMTKAYDYFKIGISVAPVTDWKFYDAIYTERYMSLPDLNPEGYKESSVLNKASQLKGKLYLIHGDADDNVHLQNTMALVRELIKANKQFNLMIYPGRDHSIAGDNARLHLFQLITDFIINNL